MPRLVLGPILRFADASAATIWVQTDAACEVEILGTKGDLRGGIRATVRGGDEILGLSLELR